MRPGRNHIILAGIILGLYAFKINAKMTDESMIINWVNAIEKIPGEHFLGVPTAEELPNPPKTESRSWTRHFFQQEMSPYDPARKPRHSYVCNNTDLDLLKHEIQLPGLETVVVYEGRNFFITKFSLPHHPSGDELGLAQKKAEQLLNMHGEGYKWKFNSKQTIDTDVLLSTNKDLSILFMPDWTGRADALIRDNKLYLVTYKKLQSVTGLLNDYEWFPDELRH